MSDSKLLYEKAIKKRDEFVASFVMKSWKDEAFRKDFLADPKKVLEKEVGHKLPEGVKICALEETGEKIYFVIPQKPELPATDESLSDEGLAKVAAGLSVLYEAPGSKYTVTGKDDQGTVTSSKVETTAAKFIIWW
jgi:hypothetical protein